MSMALQKKGLGKEFWNLTNNFRALISSVLGWVMLEPKGSEQHKFQL